MKTQTWKTIGTIILVFFGGLALVFTSFALTGFPFPTESIPNLIWVEVVLLVVLLGIPLFR